VGVSQPRGERCDPITITRDNFELRGFPDEEFPYFDRISLRGADGVGIADVRADELQMTSADSFSTDKFIFERARIVNSTATIVIGYLTDATIIGSTVSIFGPPAELRGDIELINSTLSFTLNGSITDGATLTGRLILRAGSYVEAALPYNNSFYDILQFAPGSEVICDPQTSRLYAPGNFGVPVSFDPPKWGVETCLIVNPYEH